MLLSAPLLAAIFGQDDRKDVFETSQLQQELAKSVVALFDESKVAVDSKAKRAVLKTEEFTRVWRIYGNEDKSRWLPLDPT